MGDLGLSPYQQSSSPSFGRSIHQLLLVYLEGILGSVFPFIHIFPTFSKISLKAHFTPVCMKKKCNSDQLCFEGSKAGGRVPFWPSLLPFPSRRLAASPGAGNEEGGGYSLGAFPTPLLPTPGARVPATHSRTSRGQPPHGAHPRAPGQLGRQCGRREHFCPSGKIYMRPVCSQSESFCFGKVGSFGTGRVGTRKELKTPEKGEVRVKGDGKESG